MKLRSTKLELTEIRLRIAMEALSDIAMMRPRNRAVAHALSAFQFLTFCGAGEGTKDK